MIEAGLETAMAPQVMQSTNRVRRTWLERLLGYMRVFETELTDGEHTVYARDNMAGYPSTEIRKPGSETEFERNCVVLFKHLLNDPNVKRLGTRGQKQDGVRPHRCSRLGGGVSVITIADFLLALSAAVCFAYLASMRQRSALHK